MSNEQLKEELKSRLGDYLTRKGINITKPIHCLNPNHPDKNPSMSYWKEGNLLKCHSCRTTYDIFDLIELDYNITNFNEKIKKACELFGINPTMGEYKKPKATPAQPAEVKSEIKEEREDCCEYFNSLPLATSNNCSYLTARGIEDKTIELYKIRYDGKFKSLGYKPAIIIPLGNYSYCARNIDKNADKSSRYRFSSGEKEIFNIGALKRNKPIFITEGEIDALSLMQITEGQAECIGLGGARNFNKLIKFIKENKINLEYPLILNFDTDEVGINAVEELSNSLESEKIPFICYFAQGECKDINEALIKEPAKLKANCFEAIKEATNEVLKRDGVLCASACVDDFNRLIRDRVSTSCIPTGFAKLDEVLDGGLYEGLYTIGAISSLGKTTFCLQMADNIAKAGNDVIIFSLEMSKYELMAKSISRETSIKTNIEPYKKTARRIMNYKEYANFHPNELKLIEEATEEYKQFSKHLYIHEGMGDIGVKQVREKFEILERYKKYEYIDGYKPVILIDYLQILAPYSDKLTDKQNIDKSILELKRLSRDYKIPIVIISSLNRASYNKQNAVSDVSMADFKESGAIEYSSDVLLGLQLKCSDGANQKEINDNKAKVNREIELLVLKNRNGAIGKKINYTYNTLFNHYKEIDFYF